MNRHSPRGQTLVLFALTLLLLTLMVLMTIGIGMKAKEKMELQTVADAAAYSNAVATARAFNGISLMNRAFIGHMVAMTGVESLISWSGYYRAALNGARKSYDKAKEPYEKIRDINCACTSPTCVQLCQCSQDAISKIEEAQGKLTEEDGKVEQKWQGLDERAGTEANALQIQSIKDAQEDAYNDLLDNIQNGKIAGAIAKKATAGSPFGEEIKSGSAESEVNAAEVAGGENCTGPGAACTRRNAAYKDHFIYAAMGSRGFAFVTGRSGGDGPIKDKLQSLLPPLDTVTELTDQGSGYFFSSKNHAADADGGAVWGDDHGNVSVRFARGTLPCPLFSAGDSQGIEAWVKSNDLPHAEPDEHQWTGGGDPSARAKKHTMGDCTNCPGMWPPHADYNYGKLTNAQENFGQPKVYAVLQRDYGSRNRMGKEGKGDPWQLDFKWKFFGEDTEFDNRGIKMSDGTDISNATALSAGIAYYHRTVGTWREPPNFLNPFWRATLVSAWVDSGGEADVKRTLEAAPGAGFAVEAYEELRKAGYKAW